MLYRGSHPLPLAGHLDRGEGVDGVLMNFSRRGMDRRGAARHGEAWRGLAGLGNTPTGGRYHQSISLGKARPGKAR